MNKFFLATILALMFASPAFAQQRSYNTSKALLVINDPTAARNPVRSVVAGNWKAMEAKSRLKPKPIQDIAVICEGNFPYSYIADDLYRSNGKFNRRFSVKKETTIMDICHQMEDIMRMENPDLFK